MVVCIIMYMRACVFGALLPGIQAIAGGLSRMEERARGWRLCLSLIHISEPTRRA